MLVRISRLAALRPHAVVLIAIAVALAGLASLVALPLETLPASSRVAIRIHARLSRATAEEVAAQVAAPLEERLNRLSGVTSLTSECDESGAYDLIVHFDRSTNAEIACSAVRTEVASLLASMPPDVQQQGFTVEPYAVGPVMMIAVAASSDSHRVRSVTLEASERLRGILERTRGVGIVRLVDAHRDRLQVSYNTTRLTARHITPQDLADAVDAAGFKGRSLTIAEQAAQLQATDVRSALLQRRVPLSEVAKVDVRAADRSVAPVLDQQRVSCLMLHAAPGSNSGQMSVAVQRELSAFRRTLPPGVTCTIVLDRSTFASWSIYRFAGSIIAASLLAILCHFLLTANIRATIALGATVGVHSLGFAAALYCTGSSCSLATIFALVLSLCVVLLDCVGIVHEVSRNLSYAAESPRNALARALKGLVAPSAIAKVVMVAALLPLWAYAGDAQAGVHHFVFASALALGCAYVASAIVLPAFLSIVMRHGGFHSTRFVRIIARVVDVVAWIYARVAQGLVWQPVFAVLLVACLWYWAATEWQAAPNATLPTEGQGYLVIDARLPAQPSASEVDSLMQRVQRVVGSAVTIEHVLALPGYSAAEDRFRRDALSLLFLLTPESGVGRTLVEERQWMETLLRKASDDSFVVLAPSLNPVVTTDNMLRIRVTANEVRNVANATSRTRNALAEHEAISAVRASCGESSRRTTVRVDSLRANRLGVRTTDVVDAFHASTQTTLLSQRDGLPASIQIGPQAVGSTSERQLNYLRVRTDDGRLVSLGQLATVVEQKWIPSIGRHNLAPATTLTAFVAAGAEVDSALKIMDDTLQNLPAGSSTARWISDEDDAEKSSSGQWQVWLGCAAMGTIALLFCYLLWRPVVWVFAIPVVLGAMLPLALLGAAAELRANGLENHLFAKAAMINVLAICMVQTLKVISVAHARRLAGDSISEAAAMAAQATSRPILAGGLMVMAFCPPMVFAQSAGAVTQHAYGVTLLGGAFSSTFLVPLLAPSLFVIVQWGSERLSGRRDVEDVWRFGQSRDVFYNLIDLLSGLRQWRSPSKESAAGAIAIVTVTGRIKPAKMGTTLAQERLFLAPMRDRQPRSTKETGRVFTAVFDHVTNVRIYGGHTIVDGVTAYEGRNPRLLESVSRATGVRILTNTGYTAVEEGRYLPSYFLRESAEELAQRWLAEYTNGIDDTGISPGFIKIGCDASTAPAIATKLCTIAALVHLDSGLTIASDAPDATTVSKQLDILAAHGVSASALIWLHAQRESDQRQIIEIGKRGAWLELDDFTATTMTQRMGLVRALHAQGLVGRILVSQHTPGFVMGMTNHGARMQRLDRVFKLLIPELFRDDFLLSQIKQMTVANPSRAYMTCVRRLTSPVDGGEAVAPSHAAK